MGTYIIKNETGEANDFKILKVADHLVAQFELDYENKILAKGKDLQEALISFGEKKDVMEPISLQTCEKDIRAEGHRRRR